MYIIFQADFTNQITVFINETKTIKIPLNLNIKEFLNQHDEIEKNALFILAGSPGPLKGIYKQLKDLKENVQWQ